VLFFQQGVLGLLHLAGAPSFPAWSLRPGPFHIPRLAVIALLGGGGGMVLGHLLRGLRPGAAYWVGWSVVGAVACSLVSWLAVMPLEGLPAGNGWRPADVAVTLLVNGAWGLGVALLLRVLGVQRADGVTAQTGEISRFR
jgi:hypothetical protein